MLRARPTLVAVVNLGGGADAAPKRRVAAGDTRPRICPIRSASADRSGVRSRRDLVLAAERVSARSPRPSSPRESSGALPNGITTGRAMGVVPCRTRSRNHGYFRYGDRPCASLVA